MPSARSHESFLVTSAWELNHPVAKLRSVIHDPLAITRWWSPVFLYVEEIDRGGVNREGFRLRCFTKGLLPHTFQFIANISEVSDDQLVVRTEGDFNGVGTIRLSPQDQTTRVFVEWTVDVCQPYIRPFLKILKPVFVWNHQWAMRQGKNGLERMLDADNFKDRASRRARPTFPHNLKWFQRPARWRV